MHAGQRLAVVSILLGGAVSAIVALAAEGSWLWMVLVVFGASAAVVGCLPELATVEARRAGRVSAFLLPGFLAVVGLVAALIVIATRHPGQREPGLAATPTVTVPDSEGEARSAAASVGAGQLSQEQPVAVSRPAPPVASPPPLPLPAPPSPGPGSVTLKHGEPVHFAATGVTLTVTFYSDNLGTTATVNISSAVAPPIVEALLGPVGQIPFKSRTGEHVLTSIAWIPEARTLDVTIDPPIR